MRTTKGIPEILVDRRRSEDDRVGEGYHAARRVLASLAPTTPTSLTPPGYQLIDTLGVGGGGATFLALREGSDRPVALKVLHAHAAPGPTRQRAWRELDLLQETHLPCLPRLLDYGVVGDRLFMATEFVSGQRLDEHARAIPPSRERWNQLAQTLARVADAVHSLNERGIIHRDLKPSNILIAGDGSPFIIDLGVAALAARDAAETLTADGVPIGTPAFMSPEQARGERGLISIRSDVYALGATACAVMTGKPPHDLEGVSLHEAVRRVGSEPARDARMLEPELPRALSAIIAKACAPHPRDRYATAAELAEDLRRFTRREPVLATRPGAWQRAMRWAMRYPTRIVTILICTLLPPIALSISAALVLIQNSRLGSVEIDRHGGWIRLRALSGRLLAAWESRSRQNPGWGRVVDLPESMGGGRGALVLVASESLGSAVRLFGEGTYDTPLVKYEPPEFVPSALVKLNEARPTPRDFRASFVRIEDVFLEAAEPRSPEIVVAFACTVGSACAIRIYSFDGRVLYECWHDGYLADIAWLRDSRQLIAAGVNSDGKWEDRGDRTRHRPYPPVVFAISPVQGTRNATISWAGFDGDIRPEWMYAVLPPGAAEWAASDFVGLNTDHDATNHSVEFRVPCSWSSPEPGQPLPTISWRIDASGSLSSASVNALWSSDPRLPKPETFKLGPLPPRLDSK